MDKQRYFYIVYSFLSQSGSTGIGSCTEYGNFINQERTINLIKKRERFDQVIITNIIEMSKEDFEEFTRTEEKV